MQVKRQLEEALLLNKQPTDDRGAWEVRAPTWPCPSPLDSLLPRPNTPTPSPQTLHALETPRRVAARAQTPTPSSAVSFLSCVAAE